MQIYIPTTGSELVLEEPWTFKLYWEYRNTALIEAYVLPNVTWEDREYWSKIRGRGNYYRAFTGSVDPVGYEWFSSSLEIENLFQPLVTLPTGTVLKVDRIYIRRNSREYDSLTFTIKETIAPELVGKKKLRFWAKLHDVNKMRVLDPREILK